MPVLVLVLNLVAVLFLYFRNKKVNTGLINNKDNESILMTNNRHINMEKDEIAQLINSGLSLTNVVTKTNETFGGMIFNTYCTCLLLATISLYGASSVFLTKMTMSKQLIWPFTTAQLILAMMSFLRVYYITNATQNLIRTIKEARISLEHFIDYQDKAQISHIRSLRHHLRTLSDSPITPMSTFSLCNGTLLSTSATVLTYLIILIQFKLSEK